MEVYRQVMEKYALILRERANDCLFDYYEAVINEIEVRLWQELMKGTESAERIKGGIEALGAQLEVVRALRREHEKERELQIAEQAKPV